MQLDSLHCIDLDQPAITGFRKFISSWLYLGEGFSILADPGPLSSIPALLRQLRALKVERLDYILLTHIHIDHAGGTGALLAAYPGAKVICHPEGVRHLTDPRKLWEGSRKVLGELADVYGEILPVPAEAIGFEESIGRTGIRAHLSPGHAQHHLCFQLEDLLFAGELCGVRYPVAQGIYLRPSTPPKFIREVALESLGRMKSLAPARLAFAHYGLALDAPHHLEIAEAQLHLWVEVARRCRHLQNREEAMLETLLREDEHLALLPCLPEDIQRRERRFLGNSFKGMLDYVDSQA